MPVGVLLQVALQPALLASQPGGFGAVGGAQFADGFGEVVAHGALGEMELLRNPRIRQALSGQFQYLALAVGQGVGVTPGLSCQLRVHRT